MTPNIVLTSSEYRKVRDIFAILSQAGLLRYDAERVSDWMHEHTAFSPVEVYAGYAGYLQSTEWKVLRARTLYERGYACEICGRTDHLHVHHVRYDSGVLATPSDLAVLCEDCHRKVHAVCEKMAGYTETRAKNFKLNAATMFADLINDQWRDGITGPMKNTAVSIIRQTFMEDDYYHLAPDHHRALALVRKKATH